jgi:hypothetical protein
MIQKSALSLRFAQSTFALLYRLIILITPAPNGARVPSTTFCDVYNRPSIPELSSRTLLSGS